MAGPRVHTNSQRGNTSSKAVSTPSSSGIAGAVRTILRSIGQRVLRIFALETTGTCSRKPTKRGRQFGKL